ncbi:hypothetical protein ACT3UM_02395 [Halomonas sp. AOP13-D3-9]
MLASAWFGGSKKSPTYGIRVGNQNRDTYFDPAWKTVTITINGTNETFNITRGFWNKCPEIRDNRNKAIRSWLQTNHPPLPWDKYQNPKFELTSHGRDHFSLDE